MPTIFYLYYEYIMSVIKRVGFVLLSLSASFADATETSFIAPLASQSLLLDITHNDKKFIAVGERGHILLSDTAEKWQQATVPSLATLNAVQAIADNIWVVGHDATILKSVDSGKTWTRQYFEPELEKPLLDIMFFDENNGIAVGAYGLFLRTENGGETWVKEIHIELLNPDDTEYLQELKEQDPEFYQQELASILPHLNRLSLSGSTLYLAGEAGLLASSQDQGKTWQRMYVDYVGSFFDIQKTQSGRLLAAGLRGNIFEWSNNLLQWQSLNSGTTSTLNSIVSVNSTTSLVVGNNGAMVWIHPQNINFVQMEDGKSLTNAVALENDIIAVSEVGVKSLKEGGH